MTNPDMTIDDLRDLLVRAIATEAGLSAAEVSTDVPFTAYGLDSMAALAVGMEIEDSCHVRDLPVDLLWDYPTVDDLVPPLWKLMTAGPTPAGVETALVGGEAALVGGDDR